MNPKNQAWQPLDPAAGSLPQEIESALVDADLLPAFVVILVDSEIDRDWGAQATLAVAKKWAASGQRVILADGCLDCPVLHEVVGVENREGVSDMVLYGASARRFAGRIEDRLMLAPAGTPVVEVADVLKHVKWDMMINGCREVGATLVFYVSTGTPGVEAMTERAEGILVLAPASKDVGAILGSASGPLIAVLGPANEDASGVATVKEEGDGASVEGLAGLPEVGEPEGGEPEVAELEAAEPEVVELEAAEPEVVELEAAEPEVVKLEAAEPEVVEPEVVELEAAEPEVVEPEVVELETAEPEVVEPEVVEPAVEQDAEVALPIEATPVLQEDDVLPAFTVDDAPGLPSSAGEDAETPDAFGITDLEGAQYGADDSPEVAAETADLDSGTDLEAASPADPDVEDRIGLEDAAADVEEPSAPVPAGAVAGDGIDFGETGFGAPELTSTSDSLSELVVEEPSEEADAEDSPPARRLRYRGLARLERRRKRVAFVRQFLTALVTISIVGGGGVAAAYYGLVTIPGITRVRSYVPPPAALPGPVPQTAIMSHVLLIDSWRTIETPLSTADALRSRLPDLLFFITPMEVEGARQFALYVGPAYSAVEADALKDPLAVVMTRLDPNDWSVLNAPYAFFSASMIRRRMRRAGFRRWLGARYRRTRSRFPIPMAPRACVYTAEPFRTSSRLLRWDGWSATPMWEEWF